MTCLIVRSGSQDEALLAHPTEELSQAYKKFLKCLPKGHEARIEDGPPRLEAVIDALTTAEHTWKSNREKTKAGRMRGLFSKVAVTMNKHRELFAMIPSSDKYISLVAGSVSAIIKVPASILLNAPELKPRLKATVNHEKIAESVSIALDDLSDDIAYWKDLFEANERNMRIEHYISNLYVVVFKFLARIMTKWSSKSSVLRLFRSFDSEFFKEEIEDKKTKIRDLEYRLRRQSDLAIQRNTNKIIPESAMVQLLADSQAEFEAHWLMRLKEHELKVGRNMKDTLEEQFRNQRKEQREIALRGLSSTRDQPIPAASSAVSHQEYNKFVQVRPRVLSQLRSYTAQEHILTTIIEQSQFLNINLDIFSRIQAWNAASTSQTLWIQGPFQVPQPSKYTQLSAHVVMTAQEAHIPVLYYICDSMTGAIDLLYSLIAQLVQCIPDGLQSQVDFGPTRFEALDETDRSIKSAITLFKDLLTVGPYVLFIVIDGLQVLEASSSDLAPIQDLVDVLRFAGEDVSSEQSRITKTLFTTDGFTEGLIHLGGAERLSSVDFADDDGAGPEIDGIEVGFL